MSKRLKKIQVEQQKTTPTAPKDNTTFIMLDSAAVNPFVDFSGREINANKEFWRWGCDNIFPYGLALLARSSATHRRIMNDIADYVSGKGFSFDDKNENLAKMVQVANGTGESLRSILNNVALDKRIFGNAFVEVITDRANSFLSFFHQDATKCRVAYDKQHIILNSNWYSYNKEKSKRLPIFPRFEEGKDGYIRSIIHYKDYEPEFTHYGIPAYIAGIGVSTIAWKTDKWNISRLENSFQLSGVLVVDKSCTTEEQAQNLKKEAEKKFAGKPGKILMLLANGLDGKQSSSFTPIQSNNEGDWKALHDQATTDIVVAHSWFRSLSGLDYTTGFNSERILYEYEVALNTLILNEQQRLMEPLKQAMENILNIDCESLSIINKPPITIKPTYMKIWEARKADGMDYDENDPEQQKYLANISQNINQNNDKNIEK